MDAQSLLALYQAPLSSLGFPVTVIDEFIVQVDSGMFLLLTKRGADLSVLPEPAVHSVAWAPSVGALRRVVKMDIESDDGIVLDAPPFLSFDAPANYGKLQAECKARWPSSTLETASYRIATDGKFICRNIETPAASFHFRSPTHDNHEVPFVIKRKLAKG
jgi:hypothetical protein